MKTLAFVVFLTYGVVGFVNSQCPTSPAPVDYCSTEICSDGNNIGCNNNGAFGPDCPSVRTLVTITPELENAILESHNSKRDQLARGNYETFLTAKRMASMRWSNELAELAALNVKRCIFAHDACHNTNEFHWSGQNIAKVWWSGGTNTDSALILPLIDAWWSEYKDTTWADIENYPSNPSQDIGHFTVMTAEKNIAVGCAAIRYADPTFNNWESLTFACNYARTNIIGLPMYESGPVASGCQTGTNPSFTALCSSAEVYDVNKA